MIVPYSHILYPISGGGGFDPFTAPAYPEIPVGVIDVTATNINTITPSPGDVVRLTASATLTSGKTISGWAGTLESPITLLGNGYTFFNRTLTIDDCQFVRFFDIDNQNSTGNGIVITQCSDCVFTNISGTNAQSNGIRVLGTVPSANTNRRLRFFNVTAGLNGSGSGDDFTFHAGNAAENNGTTFLVSGYTMTGVFGDSGMDVTSGSKIILLNGTSLKQFNFGHGISDFYALTHVMSGVTGDSVFGKNTDGVIFLGEFSGTGNIDLSVQQALGIRGDDPEGTPSETANTNTGLFNTYELQTWNNSQTIQNNTGTIITPLAGSPIASIGWLSEFVI